MWQLGQAFPKAAFWVDGAATASAQVRIDNDGESSTKDVMRQVAKMTAAFVLGLFAQGILSGLSFTV
eukprot:SAG22_NODE_360_length_11744_cov_37.781623_12_plen_67_part_00